MQVTKGTWRMREEPGNEARSEPDSVGARLSQSLAPRGWSGNEVHQRELGLSVLVMQILR